MSIVKETLIAELQMLVKTSTELKKKLNSATTKTKQKYYLKKLHRNNNAAVDVIVALEKINKYQEKELQKIDTVIQEPTKDSTLPDDVLQICQGINERETEREYNDESSDTITG